MITTAFLLKVIIYGLIAAVIIPAIDFMMFVIRESRRPGYQPDESSSQEAEWRSTPSPPITRRAPVSQRPPRLPSESLNVPAWARRHEAEGDGAQVTRRHTTPEAAPAPREYVASNGVTIRPNISAIQGSTNVPRTRNPLVGSNSHPHAEYWSYGSPRFYEG